MTVTAVWPTELFNHPPCRLPADQPNGRTAVQSSGCSLWLKGSINSVQISDRHHFQCVVRSSHMNDLEASRSTYQLVNVTLVSFTSCQVDLPAYKSFTSSFP